jgi:hypothetical protein
MSSAATEVSIYDALRATGWSRGDARAHASGTLKWPRVYGLGVVRLLRIDRARAMRGDLDRDFNLEASARAIAIVSASVASLS